MKRSVLILVALIVIPLIVGFAIGYNIRSPEPQSYVADSSSGVFMPALTTARQDKGSDDITASRRTALTRAIEKISPAVVGINVTEIREEPGIFSGDPYFRRFFQNDPFWNQFFGRKYEVQGLGSGFIISPDGYIITNDHVAGNASKITVTLVGGQRLQAELIGTDPLTDIALLKVKGNNLPYVTIGNSDDIIVGEWSIALGNPFGLFEINDKPTATVGVISSLGMNLGQVGERVYRDMIETDAAINGGNSGGPLVNSLGEVIGVNTLIFTGGQSNTFIGYGFAIPINRVKNVVSELKKHRKVTREFNLGFEVQKVDGRIARYFGMDKVEGIIVSDVQRGSAAEKAGLKIGDIILTANNERVNSEEAFVAVLSDAKSGTMVELKIFRDRKTLTVKLSIEGR